MSDCPLLGGVTVNLQIADLRLADGQSECRGRVEQLAAGRLSNSKSVEHQSSFRSAAVDRLGVFQNGGCLGHAAEVEDRGGNREHSQVRQEECGAARVVEGACGINDHEIAPLTQSLDF